jgi:hypothetical protein
MTEEERLLRLENAYATVAELAAKGNKQVDNVDDRLNKLRAQALSANERGNQYQTRLDALVAAQVKLTDAKTHTEAIMKKLAEA